MQVATRTQSSCDEVHLGPRAGAPLRVRVLSRRWMGAVVLLGSIVAVATMHDQVPALLQALASIDRFSLVLVSAIIGLTFVGGAFMLRGIATVPIPIGVTVCQQMAGSFAGRISPVGAGGWWLDARFLQGFGMSRRAATTAAVAKATLSAVMHIALVVALWVPKMSPSWVLGAAATVLAAAFIWCRWRTPVTVDVARQRMAAVCQQLAVMPCVAMIAVISAQAAALWVALRGAGIDLPYAQVLAVYTAASSLVGAIPIPGGIGSSEAAIIGGLAMYGAPVPAVTAGVLAYRCSGYLWSFGPGAIALWWCRTTRRV